MQSSRCLSRLLPLLLLASSSLVGAGLALTALEAVMPQAAIAQKKPSPPKPSKPKAGQNSGNTGNSTGTSITIESTGTGTSTEFGNVFP